MPAPAPNHAPDLTYSDAALAVLAAYTRASADRMRALSPEASNATVHDWLEALGRRHAAGLPFTVGGRLMRPEEIEGLGE
jgi:hypothetical protein